MGSREALQSLRASCCHIRRRSPLVFIICHLNPSSTEVRTKLWFFCCGLSMVLVVAGGRAEQLVFGEDLWKVSCILIVSFPVLFALRYTKRVYLYSSFIPLSNMQFLFILSDFPMCKVFLLIIVEYISYISPSQNETKVIKVGKKKPERTGFATIYASSTQILSRRIFAGKVRLKVKVLLGNWLWVLKYICHFILYADTVDIRQ